MHVAFVGVAVLVAFFALAIFLLMFKDRASALVSRVKNPPEKVAAERAAFEQRLRSPDWAFYEEHLQRSPPATLREIFSSESLLSCSHHFSDYYVTFSPIDRAALNEAWVMPGVVAFADSDGDPIFLKPGASSPDTVFIAFHDGGGIEELAPNIAAFVGGLRNAA